MAINKIQGNILSDNLVRGSNLAFQTDLVYIDVTNGRVGINEASPETEFDVFGTAQVSNIRITSSTANGIFYASNDQLALTSLSLTWDGNALAVVGNVTANSGSFSQTLDVTGNLTAGNISTAGSFDVASISAIGNIVGNNLVSNNDVTTVTVTASGNIQASNINSTGEIVAVGNISSPVIATGTVTTSTGDLVLDSTAGNVQWAGTGNIVMNGQWINNLADPNQSKDAATKQYVDDAVSAGIHIHAPVDVESPTPLPSATYSQGGTTYTVNQTIAGNVVVFSTAANLQPNDQLWFSSSFEGIIANIAYFVVSAPNTSAAVLSTEYNGAPVNTITSNASVSEAVVVNSGVGATLTATANGALTIDGYTVSTGNRVLVYTQTNQYENGVYSVTQAGNVSAPWILTRATDSDLYVPDTNNGLDQGSYYYVKYGDTGAGESYVLTQPSGPFIIGLANLEFTQFSATQVYTANTAAGLVLNGTIFSAKVDNDTTAFDGGGNISVKPGANLVTPNIGNATGNSLVLSGNGLIQATTLSITGNIDTGNVNATGNVTAGNLNSSNSVTGQTLTISGNISGGNIAITGLTQTQTLQVTADANVGNLSSAGTVTATGNISGGNISTLGLGEFGNVVVSGNTSSGNIFTPGEVNAGTLWVSGNAIVGGNLAVNGNISYVNVETLAIEDPIIQLGRGPNDAPLVTNDGKDRGTQMWYFSGASEYSAFVGYDNSASNIIIATDVTIANEIVTVNNYGTIVLGNISAASADILGNLSAGNINTGIIAADSVEASGNIVGNNIQSNNEISTQTLLSSGNILGANVNSNAAVTGVTITATGNLQGNNAVITNDVSATTGTFTANVSAGNVVAVDLVQGTTLTATGNLNANNAMIVNDTSTTTLTASGNVLAANVNANAAVTAVTITASGNLEGNNAVITNDVSTATVTASGNISAANVTAVNLVQATTLTATGNLNANNAVVTNGIEAATGVFTGNITANNIQANVEITTTTLNATANVSAGNVLVGNVTVESTGNIDMGSGWINNLADPTANSDAATKGYVDSTIDDFTGNITFSNTTISTSLADANITLEPTGTGTVIIDTTTGLVVPVGNTAQQPSPAATGTIRFNTDVQRLEVYDGAGWEDVAANVTNQILYGDNSTAVFTLDRDTTTAAALVAINGIIQLPVVAYSVAGNQLTFTQAPAISDTIDIRFL